MSSIINNNNIKNNVIIVISKEDQAGMNMLPSLLNKRDYKIKTITSPDYWPDGDYYLHVTDGVSILVIPGSQIFTDYFANGLDAELLIFASKHSSSAGQKALLVHTTGIWQKETGHGGNDYELAIAPADVLAFGYNLIKKYQKERSLDYWTGIECTHHGPSSLEIPVAYFEAGGTEAEWNDLNATKLIADVIDVTVDKFLNGNIPRKPAFIGLGGNHYCSRFIKILNENKFSLGHVLPKYAIKELPSEMLAQAYVKTMADDKIFLIDKKGIKAKDRDRFIDYIKKNNWKWEIVG